MKLIINSKLYDTETSELIGTYEYSNSSDFHWYKEELYQKKTGEFFLYGHGGALSKYSEFIDCNNWTSGEDIIPLSDSEARDWLEKYSDAETYIKVFGTPEE